MPISIPTYDETADELVPVDYYTADEVADMLPVRPTTIRQYVREGKWPALRVGQAVYFSKAHIGFAVESMTQHVGHISEEPVRLGEPLADPDTETLS